MHYFLVTFFFLLFGHALADYPLQGPYLSEAKNRHTEIGRLYWRHGLFGHAVIHGGFVALFTGSIALGTLEVICHAVTDYYKCEKKISYNTDQAIHIACKVLWAACVAFPALPGSIA